MKKPFLLLIIIILISCQEKDWKTKLQEEITGYKTSEKIDKEYIIKHNSGNDILVRLFKPHSNGLTKLSAQYERPELGNWEKLFYVKNGKVLYSRNFGIAPVRNIGNDTINRPKYLLIEKNYWFKNDSIGKEEIKELEMSELESIEVKKAELLKMEFILSDLNNKDYKLIESDFKALSE